MHRPLCAQQPPLRAKQQRYKPLYDRLSAQLQPAVDRQVASVGGLSTLAGCEMLSQVYALKSGRPLSMIALKMSSS